MLAGTLNPMPKAASLLDGQCIGDSAGQLGAARAECAGNAPCTQPCSFMQRRSVPSIVDCVLTPWSCPSLSQVLTEVYGQRPLPLPEHVGVSLVLHCIVDQRQEVRGGIGVVLCAVC